MNSTDSHAVTDVTGGFVALGYDSTTMVLWSRPLGQVVSLTPSNLTKHHLAATCNPEWARANYTKEVKDKLETDWDRLAADIVIQCQIAGPYDESMVRGQGIWRHGEHPDVLVINGRSLWRTDGVSMSRADSDDGYIYAKGATMDVEQDTPVADENDIDLIVDAINAMSYQRKTDSRLLLGWLVAAVVPGALTRRPHVIITGRRGSGKTALLQLIGALLGRGALEADGRSSTAAGLRQKLRGQARALVIDEAEGEHTSMRGIIELLRSAYSDQAGAYKGTVAGEALHFQLSTPAVLGMINEPRLEPADRTRIVTVDLDKLAGDSQPPTLIETLDTTELARRISPRFRRLVLSLWPTLRHNIEAMRRAVRSTRRDHRAADTIGVLLGAYVTLVERSQISLDEALEYVHSTDLRGIDEAQGTSDESDALEMLFDARINVGAVRYTVREVVLHAISGSSTEGRAAFDDQLRRYGIRVDTDKRRLIVATSQNHPGLRELYSGTKLGDGGWGAQLRRIDGATKSALSIQSGEKPRAVVCIPIPVELQSAAGAHLRSISSNVPTPVDLAG